MSSGISSIFLRRIKGVRFYKKLMLHVVIQVAIQSSTLSLARIVRGGDVDVPDFIRLNRGLRSACLSAQQCAAE